MSKHRRVLLIGGSDAGKTNYLTRFWLALRDGQSRFVEPNGQPQDAEYLHHGAKAQLSGKFVGRTPDDTEIFCEIPIRIGDVTATLVAPDRPGEQWVRIYAERRWPPEWNDWIGDGTGCLILVRAHSDDNIDALDWISVQQAYGSNAANLDGSIPPREAKGPPTQVMLVEWLQMLSTLFQATAGVGHRPRIGIVVTAWDLLSEDDQEGGPTAYLNREFPLLADFIANNTTEFDFSTFATSIYGGDFKKDAKFVKAFQASDDPKSLGYVLRADGAQVQRSDDLTMPVAWALGLPISA